MKFEEQYKKYLNEAKNDPQDIESLDQEAKVGTYNVFLKGSPVYLIFKRAPKTKNSFNIFVGAAGISKKQVVSRGLGPKSGKGPLTFSDVFDHIKDIYEQEFS